MEIAAPKTITAALQQITAQLRTVFLYLATAIVPKNGMHSKTTADRYEISLKLLSLV